jgi:hypothetical protein
MLLFNKKTDVSISLLFIFVNYNISSDSTSLTFSKGRFLRGESNGIIALKLSTYFGGNKNLLLI